MSDAEISTWMDGVNAAQRSQGISGVVNIIISIICIWLAWRALQSFRFDVFLRDPKGPQAKLLMILLSTVIGYLAAKFIIDYLSWSMMIKSLL